MTDENEEVETEEVETVKKLEKMNLTESAENEKEIDTQKAQKNLQSVIEQSKKREDEKKKRCLLIYEKTHLCHQDFEQSLSKN